MTYIITTGEHLETAAVLHGRKLGIGNGWPVELAGELEDEEV